MADELTTPDPVTPPDPQQPDPDATSDLGDAGKRALAAERTRAKAAEKRASDLEGRLKAIEDRDKSETQKATDRADAAEKRAAEVEAAQMRLRVALRHGIDEEDVDRLRGSTEDELDADAKAFADRLKKQYRPRGDVDSGRRGEPPAATPREAFAGLMKQALNQSG